MKHLFYLSFLMIFLFSCKEDDMDADGSSSGDAVFTLTSRGVQATTFSFAVQVEEGVGSGTFYYTIQKKDNTDGTPSAAELKESIMKQELTVSGGDLKLINFPQTDTKTTYIIHGLLEAEGSNNTVATLEITTL